MIRLLRYALVLVLALASSASFAGTCLFAGGTTPPVSHALFALASDAKAFCASQSVEWVNNIGANYSDLSTYGTCNDDTVNKRIQLHLLTTQHQGWNGTACAFGAQLTPNSVQFNYTYTTEDQCAPGHSEGLRDLWSTGTSNDLPASPSAACYNSCNVTMTANGPATWVMQFLRFTAQYTLIDSGGTCTTTSPNTNPPTAPTDSDGDGIPDSIDPFPSDPGNTPPPPPATTPPPAPTGTAGATGADIGALGTIISDKLDAVVAAIDATNIKIDQSKDAQVAATQATAANIVNAIHGIPTGGGTATDMTATNGLLSSANAKLDTVNAKLDTANDHLADIAAQGIIVTGGQNCTSAPTFTSRSASGVISDASSTSQAQAVLSAWKLNCVTADIASQGVIVAGGQSCASPPTFTQRSASGVISDASSTSQAHTVLNVWKTQCATAPGIISGGTDCTTPPSVVGGDPVRNASLLLAWQTKCKGDAKDGDSGQESKATGTEGTSASDAFKTMDGSEISGPINTDWISFSHTCPAFPTVSLGSHGSWTIAQPAGFCDFLGVIRLLMISVAYLWALRIVAH